MNSNTLIHGLFDWIQTGGGNFWMPAQSSTVAPEVDWLFNFILYIATFFFVLIVGVMIYFVIRYRRREGEEVEESPSHNTALEIVWSVIPLILVIIIFYLSFKSFIFMTTPPENAYEIHVTGQKWSWMFTYSNGYVSDKLHAPVDTPVKLVMSSEDVLHSFYIPAFRIKQDLVPGRYTKLWFNATRTGTFQALCAEYCGKDHSNMLTDVIVHPPGEFEKWLAKASDFLETMPPAEAGALLYKTRGCKQCHSIDGKGNTGPTFKGIFGHEVVMADGSRLTVEENYIRESIVDPQKQIVSGYEPVMPTYKGRLKDKEIGAIIEYIKTLE